MSERIIVRFGATLLTNLLRGGLSFVSGILIAQGLGPSQYGNLNFLLGSFVAISQLIEMGTASAFFTFISRRWRSGVFFAIYFGWVTCQFVGTLLAIGLLFPEKLIDWIWVGEERGMVLLAFGASFLTTQAWGMVCQLGEARRQTVLVQVGVAMQAVAHLMLVVAARYWGWLSVRLVLWLLVSEYAVLIALFGPRVIQRNLGESAEQDDCKTVIREFAEYCKPLVIYAWVGFFYAFTDRWLLQQFGGAEQQGFFALGKQFANIALIATSSILKIFWKEIAHARERQEHWRILRLYTSVSRVLYFVGAWMSCLLVPYSREILLLTVGASYESAWVPLTLMFLYPVHQALGQIQGTLCYANSQTSNYVRVSFVMMGISIPATYLMLASPSATVTGLGLGAVGLAVKLVVLQVIGVNVQAYVIARTNGWRYDYVYQGTALVVLLSLAWGCKWVSVEIFDLLGSFSDPIWAMVFGTSLYAGLSLLLFFYLPGLAGLDHDQARTLIRVMTLRHNISAVEGVAQRTKE